MQHKLLGTLFLLILWLVSACAVVPLSDTTSPTIQEITTSSKVLAKSDCIPTSLIITAQIQDDVQMGSATLWYRVGTDQQFTPAEMSQTDQRQYTVTVMGLDVPGGEYGIFEFYILARDKAGNEAKSPVDRSVQLLPCVAS